MNAAVRAAHRRATSRPPFVVVEGVDGVGKSTFAAALATRMGASVYKTPGPPFSAARKLVDTGGLGGLARYHFFRAALQQDSEAIAALLRHGPVVCDRFLDSTVVANAARDPRVLGVIDRVGLISPTLTLVLTARPEVIEARLRARPDRDHEERDLAFVLRCDAAFRALGHPVLDSSRTATEALVAEALARFPFLLPRCPTAGAPTVHPPEKRT